MQHRALLERTGDRAGDRDFESVKNPGDTERNDDQRVEARPRQPVEPGRNVGLDDHGAIVHKGRTSAETSRRGDHRRRTRHVDPDLTTAALPMTRRMLLLSLFAAALFGAASASAQKPGPSANPAPLSPAEAQRTLEVLQN